MAQIFLLKFASRGRGQVDGLYMKDYRPRTLNMTPYVMRFPCIWLKDNWCPACYSDMRKRAKQKGRLVQLHQIPRRALYIQRKGVQTPFLILTLLRTLVIYTNMLTPLNPYKHDPLFYGSQIWVWCIAAVNEFLSWKGLLLWWRRGWCWPRWDAVQWEGSRHPTTLPPAFISLPQILPLIRTWYRTDQDMQRIHDLKEIISNCPNSYKSR